MEGLLTEIKSTSQQDGQDAFVIRERSIAPKPRPERVTTIQDRGSSSGSTIKTTLGSLDDVISILKGEPGLNTFEHVLNHLNAGGSDGILNLALPGPGQAKVIQILIETSIPTFWHGLDNDCRRLLADCLTSAAGVNAVLAKLQRLCAATKSNSRSQGISELLQLSACILSRVDALVKLWRKLSSIRSDVAKHNLVWKEVVSVFGSGKLLSITAEAYEVFRSTEVGSQASSLDGAAYAQWLAENIMALALESDASSHASQLLSRALSIGYIEGIVEILFRRAVELAIDGFAALTAITSVLPVTGKRRFLEASLAWLSISFTAPVEDPEIGSTIPVVAGLLQNLVHNDNAALQQLQIIIVNPQTSATISAIVRQALVLVLSKASVHELASILDKAMSMFGDRLFIDHSPILQQESIAQTILIAAGYVGRSSKTILRTILRSAGHLQAVSNRLAASSSRARWLGMIVGTAMSHLTEKAGSTMDFGISDMDTAEARTWLNLTQSDYKVGSVDQLFQIIEASRKKQKALQRRATQELPIINGKQAYGPVRPPGMQRDFEGPRISEIKDAAEDEDDDLVPYAKPDSDPEDSDEDATLVNRDKPRPPVYIRTLMSMLRDTENADKFQIALKHAAPLIRRKTGFGREVSDHAEELARILANLQDPFETEDFDTQRLQALIAVVSSDVTKVAPWLARQAFAKDYSIAQRAIMLTALGLSGRELAGLKEQDKLNAEFETSFPSKQLPARLHGIYAQPLLESTARSVETSMIQPMALAAADQTTSHLDAVKVRKFSSRMDVQRTKRKPAANELAKIFYRTYFGPLLSSFQKDITINGDAGVYTSSPVLLTTLLKTVALLLHASGPATSQLDQVTSELWELLLFLRIKAVGNVSVMEALLFSFLTMLETNADKQSLAVNSPKQLMETKEWAEMVFERTGGGNLIEGQGEEARVRTLCAGVLTKIGDIISQYQKVLLGGWSGID